MKVIILAGGFATRLWPITDKRAKPLIYINGKPIISHLVDKIPSAYDIIVCTNKVFENDFQKWRKNYPHRKIKIFIEDSGSDQFKKGALGATALVIQEEKIQEDIMLLAGDNYFGFSVNSFIDTYKNKPTLAVFDVKDKKEARKYGVVIVDGNKVSEFEEKPLEPKSTLACTGCFLFPKENLKDIIYYAQENNDDLGGVFEYLLHEKGEDVHYYAFDEAWYDIGSFSSYIAAHQDLQKEEKIVDTSSEILNSELEGAVYIGENCKLENCHIENSIIMDNVELKDCVIRRSIIDQNVKFQGVDMTQKMIREGISIIS